jgi:hypothetical protein
MKHLMSRTVIGVLSVIASAAALFGQFTPGEIAGREAFEEFLKTAEIVDFKEIGEGVTKPYKLYLQQGDREAAACWKNPSGMTFGFLEGWRFEIAAYRLDKLIGLNMVPPAVEREFQGQNGALILWAENKYSLEKIVDDNIRIPEAAAEHTEKMKWLTRAWDSLIANEDRTQQNVLYTEDWRMILIDHSRSFRATKEHTKRLMFGRRGLQTSMQGTPFLFRRLPRSFVDRIRGLSFESIRAAVGEYLTDGEIQAVLARRDLLLKEISQMVREQGEAAVLY